MERTVVNIYTDLLASNIRYLQRLLKPGVDLIAVVKGDCTGLGMAPLYPTFKECGVKSFAVATIGEAVELRALGRAAGYPDDFILVLGDVWDEQLYQVVENAVTPAMFSAEQARKLNDLAAEAGVVQPVHLKLDTGMSRIGIREGEEETALEISRFPNIKITGAFTHFARADEADDEPSRIQFERFTRMVEKIRGLGVEIPMLHVANSATTLQRPDYHLDAVRPGDALFGLNPVEDELWSKLVATPRENKIGLREIMDWTTYVAYVKEVPAGTAVGYGATFVTERPTVIATIPVGFADGYSRRLTNKGAVVINGKLAPILGKVCMDQMMVDVTDIPDVERGTEVQLIDNDLMSIAKMADIAGISVDEVCVGITKRVPKVYK